MDPKIFAPATSKDLVDDPDLLDEAINCYLGMRFSEMKGFILEYGEEKFFKDLKFYFDFGKWRNPENKFKIFAGMIIAFFQIYT